MQRFIALASLLASPVSAEAASQPQLKSGLALYGEHVDLSIIRAIEQNLREIFHASASRQIDFFSEYRDVACFPNCSRTIHFPVLCR